MDRKPRKVEEPTTPYATKKVKAVPAAPKSQAAGVKYADDAAFKKAASKIFSERKELLRKLAQ